MLSGTAASTRNANSLQQNNKLSDVTESEQNAQQGGWHHSVVIADTICCRKKFAITQMATRLTCTFQKTELSRWIVQLARHGKQIAT
jgi:hypothetical protein